MRVTRTIVIDTEINSCFHQCPYFHENAGPSGSMLCEHPDAPDKGLIITHPECDNGFPPKCPVLAKQQK